MVEAKTDHLFQARDLCRSRFMVWKDAQRHRHVVGGSAVATNAVRPHAGRAGVGLS